MSTIGILAAIAIAVLGMAMMAKGAGRQAPSPVVDLSPTPVDEAVRILARRYARGEISFDEFEHMVALLRD
ncbi:MAG: SHOCT domain-containing protein [Coriobacteriia bacterium]|nr:SHOCT domain-containing protein [Coriobacteriia bacterium]